jgi:ATP-dependent Zn protease
MAIARDTVAYHEAGHAVAAKVLGLTIDRISIAPAGDAAGHVIHDYGCNMNEVIYEDGPDRQWALERAALVAIAGEAAQRHFRPESVQEEHGGGDRIQVHQILDHLAGEEDKELRDAWERLLVIRAKRLVEQHWMRVEWLAGVLLERMTIDGAEDINHVLADAELPMEYRGKRLSFSERLALSVGKPPKSVDASR